MTAERWTSVDLIAEHQDVTRDSIYRWIDRKQSSAGDEHFARLEITHATTIKKLLLITSNPQLDDLFTSSAT